MPKKGQNNYAMQKSKNQGFKSGQEHNLKTFRNRFRKSLTRRHRAGSFLCLYNFYEVTRCILSVLYVKLHLFQLKLFLLFLINYSKHLFGQLVAAMTLTSTYFGVV